MDWNKFQARKILLLVYLLHVSLVVVVGCLARKQEMRPKPIVDLNDERDDGQSLTLVYSENIIVPPEEDEDPSDDQAPDIDKKEDLEDLDSVIEVHLDNEVYDVNNVDIDGKNPPANQNVLDSSPELQGQKPGDSSLSDSHGKGNPFKILKLGKNHHHHHHHQSPEPEKFSNIELKPGMVREPTNKESFGMESHTLNQLLMVVVVILAFLFCLLCTICLVLLVKIKLIARSKSCKTSKTSLIREPDKSDQQEV